MGLPRVLFIEPVESLRKVLESLLHSSEYDVLRGAANILQVRHAFRASGKPPDVVIIDHWTIRTGIKSLVRTLKEDNIAMILMSGDMVGYKTANELGIPFLKKPFSRSELFQAIKVALKQRKASRQR